MRLIATFLIGFLFCFFFGEIISLLRRKFFPNKHLPIHHSMVGLIFTLVGLFIWLLGGGDPALFLLSIFLVGSGIGLILHHLLSESYIFSEKIEHAFAKKHERRIDRLLEIFPGALMWVVLTSPIWLSYTLPFAVAYLIILADVYWLLNAIKLAILIITGYKRLVWTSHQDWIGKLKEDFPEQGTNFYHLILIPAYKENLEILKPAFDAIINSSYPLKKIYLAVGFEDRSNPQNVAEATKYLNKVVAPKIGGVLVTVHPFGLPGEVPGPGTNRNFMVNNAVQEFQKLHIKTSQVLATTLDADFVIHPQFLSGALYKYLSTPIEVRDKRTYTGVFLYYNNYWQTSTPMRLTATGTAFWQLAEMVDSDKYRNFASLSINFQSLLDIGLWPSDKVNDDSGFYWRAYYHFKGDYKVVPHFLPINADAVLDVSLVKTFQNQYLQQKRWAYGVEHMPYIIRQYFKNKDVNFWAKTDHVLFMIWGNLKWGTLALFVAFAGLLIPVFNPHYSQSAVSYNLPVVSSWILTVAFVGLLATIYVHEKTVPKRPKNWSIVTRIWSYIQWVLLPVVIVTISAIPIIDAQTTLMLGRYIEFRTTNKARAIPEP